MRVLAVGNSHVGALLAGWQKVSARFPQFELAFVGSHSKELRSAVVEDGRIARVHFSKGGDSLGLADYDAFVVVADLAPARVVFTGILERRYSAQVTRAAIEDHVAASLGMDIVRRLIRPNSQAPVFMLSRPERQSNQRKTSAANYEEGRACLADELARHDIVYLAQARRTLDADFVPRPEYYSNAVNLGGRTASRQEVASVGHLNAEGGREAVLDLLTCIERRLTMA